MLKPLDQHDAERTEAYRTASSMTTATGIACPHCPGELHFSDQILRPSYPPKRETQCDRCQTHTFVVA